MNNCCCAELVVDEGQQIELNVESDGGIEVGVAEQFVIGAGGNYQNKTVNITPTESAQSQTVSADVGYDALDEVEVNVAAIADDYVGSAVPRRASASLTESGATVTAPAGYYANQASKTIQTAQWDATATKSAVSNHAVTVTPTAEIINAGYRPVGTKNGTAVSVSASELVSGTKSITANGTGIDVTNYAAVNVNVSGGAPTLQDKTVYPSSSDQSITADVGYDGLGTVTAKAVTTTNLTAANIVSGVTVEVGDADDADRIASVTGTASTGLQLGPTDYPILIKNGRSGTVAVARVAYDATVLLSAFNANISSGSTSTYNDMATDGTYIWFRPNAGSTISYNGSAADFTKSSQSFRVKIPTGYNGTIPFIIT